MYILFYFINSPEILKKLGESESNPLRYVPENIDEASRVIIEELFNL